jgi:septation ring formation regulator EzrA
MSAIYHAHLSEVEKIQEQITQLEAERKAISARIRRLKVQKKEWQDRSTQMDHDVQMQEKIIRVRSTLPKVPMDLPTYRRTADTQQRRCKILWQVMIDEG